MRFTSLITLSIFAAAASAAAVPETRDIRDYPFCAVGCLREAPTGRCPPRAIDCLCHNRDFLGWTAQCFRRRCDRRDEDRAHWAQDRTCGFQGGGGWGGNGGGWGGDHNGGGGWGGDHNGPGGGWGGDHGNGGGWGGGPGGPGGPGGHGGPGQGGPGGPGGPGGHGGPGGPGGHGGPGQGGPGKGGPGGHN